MKLNSATFVIDDLDAFGQRRVSRQFNDENNLFKRRMFTEDIPLTVKKDKEIMNTLDIKHPTDT